MIWDLLRLVAFVEAAAVWGLTFAILRAYAKRYRLATGGGLTGRRDGEDRRTTPRTSGDRRSGKRSFDTPWVGLIPTHVVRVTTATLLMVTGQTALVTRHLGQVPEWYGLPVALAAYTILLYALVPLARYEYRLIQTQQGQG